MAARTRAYIKIQDGCNSFCSFCVIPYLRGLSRSRPAAAILAEARRLGEAGFREVVLAGIHLQDYGEDLGGGWNLSRLLVELRGVAQDAGIWRIRLSSIGVQSFTEEMVEILKDPLFCPHWHIPVQSGDDGVLKKMRRDYTRQEYLDTVQLLKETFEPASITTDVIVGHPGEDDDAFTNTVDLCVDVGFSKIHLFPFSPREGTRAQSMGGQVPAPVIHERMKELGALEKELSLRYKRRFVGESVEVLAEDAVYGSESGSVKMVEGFTERYVKVCFRVPADEVDSVRNTLQPVRVVEVMPEYAVGRLRRDS
jgi:threonylcarbamoyladenosine tRNA methylthiotransferase MtaB